MAKEKKGYILAGLVGAIGGGVVIALATKAVPKIMDRVSGFMEKKMEM